MGIRNETQVKLATLVREIMVKKRRKTMDIQEFAMKYQRTFGTNIEFGMAEKHGPDHCPVVEVELYTNFGTFTGSGSNKKFARAEAVKAAAASAKCPF